MRAHYLHIGKTGGCAIKTALRPYQTSHSLKLHSHPQRLRDVPEGEKAFFAVRHPVDRFVSGFNSRLRKAQPRAFREWSAEERAAFKRFATPNALAEALSSWSPAKRLAARHAMASIKHVRSPLTHWIESQHELERRAADILLIIWQPALDTDFETLKDRLGLPEALRLPKDEVTAHRTPAGFDSTLSPKALANLEAWYARDIALFEDCLIVRTRQLAFLSTQAA